MSANEALKIKSLGVFNSAKGYAYGNGAKVGQCALTKCTVKGITLPEDVREVSI
jgi:hypothetical protein